MSRTKKFPDQEPPEILALRRMRLASLKKAGWTVCAFTPPRDHELAGVKRYAHNTWALDVGGVWDHAYCLKHTNGRRIYVGEPYHLGDQELDQIAELRRLGWDVIVRPNWALHFPSQTVAVLVREPHQQEVEDADLLENAAS